MNLVQQLLMNALSYSSYHKEKEYLTQQFGCKKTTSELCLMLRKCQQMIPNPRIEDLIRSQYVSCDPICPYYIQPDYAFELLHYSIIEFGKMYSCQDLYQLSLFSVMENRMPTEFEFLLYQTQYRMQSLVDNGVLNVPQPQRQFEPYSLTTTIEQTCCMCQEALLKDQKVIILPCFHIFHSQSNECVGIENWLKTSTECPLCKKNINES